MDLTATEKALGNNAKLAVSLYLLDERGKLFVQDGYHRDIMLPMASTKKIAIALMMLKRIHESEFQLSTEITITHEDLSPGRPTNSVDRYYFMPWRMEITKTIDELLTYMLTESDNTSTDVLLNLAGGPVAINALITELQIDGHNLSFSSKKLLADYFQIPVGKSISSIFQISYAFISAFSLRPVTENALVESAEDACTAKMITDLLKLLVISREDSWLNWAREILFTKMQHCKTGETLIKKGAFQFFPCISNMGSKQGGLGGIRNDSAFIHFKNGKWVILSIHTCQSELSLNERDNIIANLAQEILIEYSEHLGVAFVLDESREDQNISPILRA